MKFGDMPNYKDGFPMKGNASAEARVEYLLKIVQIQSDKISTLELQLRTTKLDKEIQYHEVEVMLDNLQKAHEWLKNQKRDLERGKLNPFLRSLKTRLASLFSNKPFMALLISFSVAMAGLLVLSLKLKTVL